MKWLLVAEFQYNNKKHSATEHTLFELNFGRYSWKGNLTIKIELPKLEIFLKELQKSWKAAKTSMKMAKEAIRKQFDRKRQSLRTKTRRKCVARG